MTSSSFRTGILLAAVMASSAFGQNAVLRSSTFDAGSGFPSISNSRLQSVIGQTVVGLTRVGNSIVTSGILADSLLQSPLTGVDGTDRHDLPMSYELLQNYPNPFNPSTTIDFRIPVASEVRLVVYDILGRELAVILNERRPAGSYGIPFNGSGFASGVYVYQLRAGQYSATRKMILIR